MNIIEEFKKLTKKDAFLFFAISLGIICPGILWMWTFEKQLLEDSTAAKLLLLAGAIGMPCAGFSTMLIGIITGERSAHSNDQHIQFMMGCFSAAAACLIPLLSLGSQPKMGTFALLYLGALLALSLVSGWNLRRDKLTLAPAIDTLPTEDHKTEAAE